MNATPSDTSKRRVVIAGGGVAGLELVLALKALAGDRVDVTLVSPDEEFAHRPGPGVPRPPAAGRRPVRAGRGPPLRRRPARRRARRDVRVRIPRARPHRP